MYICTCLLTAQYFMVQRFIHIYKVTWLPLALAQKIMNSTIARTYSSSACLDPTFSHLENNLRMGGKNHTSGVWNMLISWNLMCLFYGPLFMMYKLHTSCHIVNSWLCIQKPFCLPLQHTHSQKKPLFRMSHKATDPVWSNHLNNGEKENKGLLEVLIPIIMAKPFNLLWLN